MPDLAAGQCRVCGVALPSALWKDLGSRGKVAGGIPTWPLETRRAGGTQRAQGPSRGQGQAWPWSRVPHGVFL